MSQTSLNLQYQGQSLRDNTKFLDQSQISEAKTHEVKDSFDQSLKQSNPIEHKQIKSGLSYSDLVREGEHQRQNIFLEQNISLIGRNVKMLSETVLDLTYNVDDEGFDGGGDITDQFEINLHKILDSRQGKQGKQENKYERDAQDIMDSQQIPADIQQMNNRIQSKNSEDCQFNQNDNNFSSQKVQFKRKDKKFKQETVIHTNLNLYEINLQMQQQQSDNTNSNRKLGSQIVSKMSQKPSSVALTYSSNQDMSQQIMIGINQMDQFSNNCQYISDHQKYELNTINFQTEQEKSLLNEIKYNDFMNNNNLATQEIPTLGANNLHNNKKTINQISIIEKDINRPEDKLNEQLKKQQKNRISAVQSQASNKFSFKFFKKANMIKKFMKIMVSQLPSKIFQKLEQRHFNIIGDSVFPFNTLTSNNNETIFEAYPKKSLHISASAFLNQKNLKRKNSFKFVKQIPIVQPNGAFQIFWNILFLTFLLIQLIVIPLLCVYDQAKQKKSFLFLTEPLTIAVLIMQILLNLNTGFYNEGEIVKSRLQIFKKYFRFYLWIDLVTIIAVIFAMQKEEMQWFKMVFIFRIFQVLQLLNNIEEHFQLQQKYYTIYELIKLYILIYFIAHYSSCIFYSIGKYEYQNNLDNDSWIKKFGVYDESWTVIYLDSIYFSFVNMVTVGFGDIVPVSCNEKIYVTFFSVVSCGIFGYVVNTIGSIFSELSQKQATYKLKKFEITQYMEGRQIQRASQIKVLKYLEYMYSQEEERNYLYKGEIILNGISKHLREEVQQDFFGKILLNSAIFKNAFSNKLIQKLSLVMKELTLGPEDIIFNKGDTDNKLYYIFKGAVENTLEINNQTINFGQYNVSIVHFELNQFLSKIKQGEFFGQSGFFTGLPRHFTAKSKGTTHIVYCKRDDMLKLIQENPQDKEQFCLYKDEILFKQNICGSKCLSCLKPGHIEENCDYVNIKINKQSLFAKNNYSIGQQRCQFVRKHKKKYNALSQQTVTKKLLKLLRINCVMQAMQAFESWDDFIIFSDEKMSDKEFFLRMPKVSYDEINQCMQETEYSLCSVDEEDMQIFTKDDFKGSQEQIQGVSDFYQASMFSHTNIANSSGLILNHQTNKLNIKNEEFPMEKSAVSSSKTKKDTFSKIQSSQLIKKHQQTDFNQQTSLQNVILPAQIQQESNPTFSRQNYQKTVRTMKRHDSTSSLKNFQDNFKRNATKNFNHLGTQIQAAQYINLQIACNNMAAKQFSDSRIESPKYYSNLSDLNQKISDNNKQEQKQLITNAENVDQQKQVSQNFEQFYFEKIEKDFDVMKEYNVYYPQNNITQVIRQIKKIWMDKLSKKREKSKHSKKLSQKPKSSLLNMMKKIDSKNSQKINEPISKIQRSSNEVSQSEC